PRPHPAKAEPAAAALPPLAPPGALTVKAPPESAPRITNGVYVQVASYQDREGAEREEKIWRDHRFRPVISPWKAANGALWQRVLLGPYPNTDKARETARRLKKDHGLDFYLLVHFPAN
ncbi:MAG: SPOR domain-containing protein, partial [Pseudomonadota bacterium]